MKASKKGNKDAQQKIDDLVQKYPTYKKLFKRK